MTTTTRDKTDVDLSMVWRHRSIFNEDPGIWISTGLENSDKRKWAHHKLDICRTSGKENLNRSNITVQRFI